MTADERRAKDRERGRRYYREVVAADPVRRKAHADRVTADAKAKTYTDRTCEACGRDFVGPPLRLHCSRACLDDTIRSGKYRSAHHRYCVAAELAALAAELERRSIACPR